MTDLSRQRFSAVAQQWRAELAVGGYERRVETASEFQRVRRLSRAWRTILKRIRIPRGATVLEFGCGGGNQLIPLALRGYRCVGIDASEHVLARCRQFLTDVEKFAGRPLDVRLHHGDFLRFRGEPLYDLVFNFGVVEHFLDDAERYAAIARMFDLCVSGGYVVSVVPSGMHPFRNRMRAEGLGGYQVPEIDYTPTLLATEMTKAGAVAVQVIPHNLFGYLLTAPTSGLARIGNRFGFLVAQLLPRIGCTFNFRHASSLICLGRKR